MDFVILPDKERRRFVSANRQNIIIHGAGIRVVENFPQSKRIVSGDIRGEVNSFSRKSRARLGRRMSEACHVWRGRECSLIALTWHENKTDITDAKESLQAFLSVLRRAGFRQYIWWMEFQKRGSVHFHFLIPEHLSHDYILSHWGRITGQADDELFQKYGVSVSHRKLRGPEAAAYATKYGLKREQKDPGEAIKWVGRFWGSSQNLELPAGVLGLTAEAAELLCKAYEAQVQGMTGARVSARKGTYLMFRESWEYQGRTRTLGGLSRGQVVKLLHYFRRKNMLVTNTDFSDPAKAAFGDHFRNLTPDIVSQWSEFIGNVPPVPASKSMTDNYHVRHIREGSHNVSENCIRV